MFKDIRFLSNRINFVSELLNIKKKENAYLIEGTLNNKQSIIDKDVLKILKINLNKLNLDNSNFISKNKFSLEIDKNFKIKNVILNSDVSIDKIKYKKQDLIDNYFLDINKIILLKDNNLQINYKNKKFSIIGKGKLKIKEKFNKIEYSLNKYKDEIKFKSNFNLENIFLKKREILREFFPLLNDKINLKNSKIKINYENKKLSISGDSKIKLDKEFDDINFLISKKDNKLTFDIDLDLIKTQFKIDKLNYKKKDGSKFKLNIIGNLIQNQKLIFSKINISENKNKIKIDNLLIGRDKQIIKIDRAKFDYVDIENKRNQFTIQNNGKNNYKLNGLILNANKLITNALKSDDEQEIKFYKKKINLSLAIDEVYIDKIYSVKNLNGKLILQNNKVKNANIEAKFKNQENIFFSIKSDKEGNKITTLISSWAKPLISRYKFIKGFDEGVLSLRSEKNGDVSNSLLIIDNFKVKEIPLLAKLLAMASLQGIADLLTGEGIRFTDLEMKFSNEKNIMKIDELYAIGPSISLLIDGYLEKDKVLSLRGTLVPASTINKTIASIPLIGDLLVGKKVGEGIFGVSFKIKGSPDNPETSVNPIKTLTPRFITRTLEKIKKN